LAVATLVLLILLYLLAVTFGIVASASRLGTPEIILVVALLAGLAFFDVLAEFTFGTTGLTFKLKRVEARQAELESEVDRLTNRVTELFLNTMAPSMYDNLVKLRDRRRGEYSLGNDLKREMTQLRDAGYLEDFNADGLPPKCDVLADYFTITPLGRQFLELRESLSRTAQPSSH